EFDASLAYPIHRIPETRRLGDRPGDGVPLFRKFNTLLWHLKKPSEANKLLIKIRNEYAPNVILMPRWEERSHFWCRACCKIGIPYILIAHGMELVEKKSSKWNMMRRQDLYDANLLIPNSTATKDILLSFSLDKNRMLLFHPRIRPEKLKELSSEVLDNVLSKLDLSGRRYILTLCRLVRRKGVDLAIRAFADIADDFPELFLAIAGDGPELSDLRSLAVKLDLHERVKFLGEVDDITKRSLFQGCEFFIMPNRPIPGDMEGFGIVFLEAA
ncbi:MAG: glycosyltransferase, partial [bacterium]|nr:glycosyltransferase [bacterium]